MRRPFSFLPTLLLSLGMQILILGFAFSLLPTPGHAQSAGPNTAITPTGGTGSPASLGTVITSGTSTVPTNLCTANCVVTGGTRSGNNIFHSFGDFNIAAMDGARFQTGLISPLADPSVSNILGRITGGNPSSIFGNVNSSTFYPAANLFLMNPAGFLFGPNATVNVGGMVAFTSADYLRFTDGKLFNATPNPTADAVLSTAPVAAYGFLGSNPGAITVQGSQLTVTPGQSISLVGGDITIQSGTPDGGAVQSAKLSAPSGQINLASVASPGEVLVGNLAYAANSQSFGALGTIQISEQSIVDVSGNGGGTVLIRGGNFVIDNSTISANVTGPGPITNGVESIGSGVDIQVSQNAVIENGALVDVSVVGNATSGVQYGGVRVNADHVEVRGIADFETFNFVFTNIQTNIAPLSTGNSGNIILEGNSILLKDAAQIQSVTNAAGKTGNIKINANQNVEIDTAIIQSAAQQTFGDGGTIVRSTGDAGNIELTSTHGDISITDLSSITSQVVESPGTVGTIALNAVEGNILLSDSSFFTYIQPPVNAQGVRAALIEGSGEVRINANNMQMNGGNIDLINLSAQPAGDVIVIIAGKLSLSSGSFSPSRIQAAAVGLLDGSVGGAPSAGLNIRAHDISITDGSSIATDTNGTGAAGPLNISAVNLQLTNGGKITSSTTIGIDPLTGLPVDFAPTGSAGSVSIQGLIGPAQSVLVDGQESGILTSTVGTGAGGNISILANTLTVQNGGTLSAATSGTAPSATGGTITVKADMVTINTGGTMTAASSGPGASGEVVVQGLASPAQSILIDGSGSGIFTNTSDTGPGGDIHLSGNSVTLQNGGALSAATTGIASSATGGIITVNAEHVAVNSQGLITADTNGIAEAGTVDINTGTLAINSGGQIRSSSGAETEQVSLFALSSTAATTPLTGGTISIQGRNGNGSVADSVTIDGSGSGIFTQSTGSRTGGDINILTGQSVAMTNGAGISASSTGTGNAGNIQISAGSLFGMANSKVTTEANQASGGTIKITTTPAGTVEMTNSTISASVNDGTGGGGSVDIDPQYVILQNSQILANAVFGPGGNINITTNLLLPDTASVISASSQFGQQGTIFIQSPISPASGKINPIGRRPLIPTSMVSQRCAALAGGNVSSFTVAGRDSLPAEPGSWLPSPLALVDGLSGLSSPSGSFGLTTSKNETNQIDNTNQTNQIDQTDRMNQLDQTDEIDQTNQPILSLRKLAPAGFLTQSFAMDSSDCQS